jgi:hypothetical protein
MENGRCRFDRLKALSLSKGKIEEVAGGGLVVGGDFMAYPGWSDLIRPNPTDFSFAVGLGGGSGKGLSVCGSQDGCTTREMGNGFKVHPV